MKIILLYVFFIFFSCSFLTPAGIDTYGSIREISHSKLKHFLDKPFLEFPEEFYSIRRKVNLKQIEQEFVFVALKEGEQHVNFQFDEPFDLFLHKKKNKQKLEIVQGKVSISQSESQIILKTVNGETYISDTLVFKPKKLPSGFHFKGLSYSGELRVFIHISKKNNPVVKRWKGKLVVVNKLEIEEYLRGVVPSEMPAGQISILEALKAQTIAARTYTYAHLGYNAILGFDIYDDVKDQVYLGKKVYPASDRAVAETKRMIMVDKNDVTVVAVYHAVCGGQTSNIEKIWSTGGKTYSYLKGIKDRSNFGDDYCKNSKYYNWTAEWTSKQLTTILRKSLFRWNKKDYVFFSKIKDMQIISKIPSGRVREINFITDTKVFKIYGDRIRWVLRMTNGKALSSTFFNLSKVGNRFIAKGKGFGHGIGMCQVGAMQQAREKRNYRQILNHYYRGVQLVHIK